MQKIDYSIPMAPLSEYLLALVLPLNSESSSSSVIRLTIVLNLYISLYPTNYSNYNHNTWFVYDCSSCSCVTLTYMSQLTDLVFGTDFKAKFSFDGFL